MMKNIVFSVFVAATLPLGACEGPLAGESYSKSCEVFCGGVLCEMTINWSSGKVGELCARYEPIDFAYADLAKPVWTIVDFRLEKRKDMSRQVPAALDDLRLIAKVGEINRRVRAMWLTRVGATIKDLQEKTIPCYWYTEKTLNGEVVSKMAVPVVEIVHTHGGKVKAITAFLIFHVTSPLVVTLDRFCTKEIALDCKLSEADRVCFEAFQAEVQSWRADSAE